MAADKKTVLNTDFKTAPKRLAVAVALALMAGSGTAWSAGLGRLSVQSGLGQPLRAEVEITALTREESASLNAKLASPDAFKQAGLEFNAALAGLRFAIDRRTDGRSFVRISSTQPINEPFVDMLLELNWATGKFVREYTFLLDPPELKLARESVEGGAGQATVVPPVAAAPSAPAPAAASAPPVTAAVPSSTAPKREPAAPGAAARPETAAAASVGDEVRVRSGDTLAGIAGRVRPPSASLDQTLASLYQANPQAFFGDINRLKSGVTLKVPGAREMAAFDPAKARELIRAQSSDFAAYRSRLAEGARELPAGKAGQTVTGAVGAQIEDKSAAANGADKLKLSKSGASLVAAAGKSGGEGALGQNRAEQNVARDAALKESQSRVKELEKNVTDLQKLLDLKNKQLADLQKQAEDSKIAGKSAAGVVAKADTPKAEAAKAEPAKVEAPKVADSTRTESAKTPEPVAAVAPEPKAKVEAPRAEVAPAAPKTEPAPKSAAKVPEPAAAAPSGGFVEDLMSNPLMLPGLGAILALGAGYGWYAMRRRKKVEKFEDSLIAADGIAANSLFGSTGGQSVDTSGAFASATKDSGVDVHATEVDPIAEAEVYIAYGREAQAEEILREAMRKQPERQAIRAKLLEIYSGRKDVAAFGALAAEMYEMAGGQNEEWPKVVTMGLALDPENALYTGREAHPQVAHDGHGDVRNQPAEPPLDELLGEEPIKAPASTAPVQSFAETMPMEPGELGIRSLSEPDVPALDFDLELNTTIGKAGEKLASSREPDEDDRSELSRAVEGRFDLPDLDLTGEFEPKAANKVRSAAPSALEEFNIDLPALEGLSKIALSGSAGGGGGGGGGSAVAEKLAADLDLSAIGLDLEPAESTFSSTAPDGVRWQEMATKLDLASAYEEIGDKEGARELLDEVVKGGDAEQQQKARSMLAKIA